MCTIFFFYPPLSPCFLNPLVAYFLVLLCCPSFFNSQDRTTLLIAHRWSSIQIADRIAVLGDGKIIEIGTPQDLLSNSTDSAFRRLVC